MSDETWLNAKKAHEMGFVDGILFAEKKMPVVPKEEEPDEEEKEDTLTAMTYSKSRNLSAFLSKVSASAESVTGTPIDQLEKKTGITEILRRIFNYGYDNSETQRKEKEGLGYST